MNLIRRQSLLSYSLLALGLFAYAVFLRIAFIRALPDPIFTRDSQDYLQPLFSFLSHGRFELSNQRTPGYLAHILLTNLARTSDSTPRYAIPIEPLYVMLALAGLKSLFSGGQLRNGLDCPTGTGTVDGLMS